jgi:hypothetical protein
VRSGTSRSSRLKAADGSFVVEKAVADPPAERVARAERRRHGLVEIRPLAAMRQAVLDEIADRRPQAAARPALDRIRRVGGDVAGQRPQHGVVRRLEAGVPQAEGSRTSSRTAFEYPPSKPLAASQYPAFEYDQSPAHSTGKGSGRSGR